MNTVIVALAIFLLVRAVNKLEREAPPAPAEPLAEVNFSGRSAICRKPDR